MMAVVAADIIDSATGEMGRTAEHTAVSQPACSAPPVSSEGLAIDKQVLRVVNTLQRNYIVLATPSTEAALRFSGPALPTSWVALAEAVFPNSRAMTRQERQAFEASFWPNLNTAESIEFSDD